MPLVSPIHYRYASFPQGVDYVLTLVILCPGKAWTSDYGNPSDPHDFDFIHPISPLHNVPTDRVLPPTILLTADRVSTYLFYQLYRTD